jgi:hypothetical protein
VLLHNDQIFLMPVSQHFVLKQLIFRIVHYQRHTFYYRGLFLLHNLLIFLMNDQICFIPPHCPKNQLFHELVNLIVFGYLLLLNSPKSISNHIHLLSSLRRASNNITILATLALTFALLAF